MVIHYNAVSPIHGRKTTPQVAVVGLAGKTRGFDCMSNTILLNIQLSSCTLESLVEIAVMRKSVWRFKVQFVKLDQVLLNKTTVYLFIYIYMISWFRKHNVQFNKTSRIVYFIYLFIIAHDHTNCFFQI